MGCGSGGPGLGHTLFSHAAIRSGTGPHEAGAASADQPGLPGACLRQGCAHREAAGRSLAQLCSPGLAGRTLAEKREEGGAACGVGVGRGRDGPGEGTLAALRPQATAVLSGRCKTQRAGGRSHPASQVWPPRTKPASAAHSAPSGLCLGPASRAAGVAARTGLRGWGRQTRGSQAGSGSQGVARRPVRCGKQLRAPGLQLLGGWTSPLLVVPWAWRKAAPRSPSDRLLQAPPLTAGL